MNTVIKTSVMGLSLFALAGCMSTPSGDLGPEAYYSDSPDGQSRLVIYRESFLGPIIQPKVHVDGKSVAVCTPGRSTTVNVAPGAHRVSGATLQEKSIPVTVPQGKTAYVRCEIGIGLVVGRLILTQQYAEVAAPKVAKLKARTAQ